VCVTQEVTIFVLPSNWKSGQLDSEAMDVDVSISHLFLAFKQIFFFFIFHLTRDPFVLSYHRLNRSIHSDVKPTMWKDMESVLPFAEEERLLENIVRIGDGSKRHVHIQHTFFLNFTAHGMSQVPRDVF
jgi:hypothetical protein